MCNGHEKRIDIGHEKHNSLDAPDRARARNLRHGTRNVNDIFSIIQTRIH